MRRLGRAGCGLVALALSIVAVRAGADEISIAEYAAALEALASDLDRGAIESASTRAAALETHRVVFGDERLAPDAGLLSAIRGARPADTIALARRIRRLAAALGSVSLAPGPAADPALVDALKAEGAIARGGEIAEPTLRPLTIPEQIVQAFEQLIEWLGDALARILEWLAKLWPRAPAPGAPASGGTLVVTLIVVAIAVVMLGVLALATVRRGPRGDKAPAAAQATGRADEDPLSRESDEWERYARELADAGRRREAVRAWYHAVLSTLFRIGRLEPRKGRTNWEHVTRLAPELPWRPQFIDITRRFEREWYGRDESSAEALDQCARLAAGLLRSVRGGEAA
jgi:hypothetical protein